MTKFESGVKVISASQSAVYGKLSDLSNLEKIKDRLPEDKVKNLSFTADTLSVEVPPGGTIPLEIVERDPEKCIKFGTRHYHLAAALQPVDTDCAYGRGRVQDEAHHRHGA